MSAKRYTAGGRKFRDGQTFTTARTVAGVVWVVDGTMPDYWGGNRNLVTAHQQGRPGIGNVFRADEIILLNEV